MAFGPGLAFGGGGGIVGIVVALLLILSGGGGGGGGGGFGVAGQGGSDLAAQCRTGADANQSPECRIVAVVDSVQEFWSGTVPQYRPAVTVFFSGQTPTGCGNATSAVGPFYCPADQQVYIDLAFYDELRQRFGARGGPFA